MKEVNKLEDGASKTIMQAIVVECSKKNTIEEQGVTDYSISLECIRTKMAELDKLIDEEIFKLKKKKGQVL
jgi:hypothetical protein